MSGFTTRVATLAALAAGLTMIGGRAEAAAVPAPNGLPVAADTMALTENVQYFWGGRRWCWYDDAWQSAGWYWCGYNWRSGLGWGGGYGWRGWGGRGGGRGGFGRGGRGGGRGGI